MLHALEGLLTMWTLNVCFDRPVLGAALGITSLVAVIMTGVTTVLCYKQKYTRAEKLVELIANEG